MTLKKYEVTIDGQSYQVSLKELTVENEAELIATQPEKTKKDPVIEAPKQQTIGTNVPAPMAGTILAVKVKLGEAVKKGDTLCILEAMKMETQVVAPVDGVVSSIAVSENQGVESNQLLLAI